MRNPHGLTDDEMRECWQRSKNHAKLWMVHTRRGRPVLFYGTIFCVPEKSWHPLKLEWIKEMRERWGDDE